MPNAISQIVTYFCEKCFVFLPTFSFKKYGKCCSHPEALAPARAKKLGSRWLRKRILKNEWTFKWFFSVLDVLILSLFAYGTGTAWNVYCVFFRFTPGTLKPSVWDGAPWRLPGQFWKRNRIKIKVPYITGCWRKFHFDYWKLKDTDSYSVVNPDQNWICRYLVRNFVFIYGSI